MVYEIVAEVALQLITDALQKGLETIREALVQRESKINNLY
jgi:hypothetical protein